MSSYLKFIVENYDVLPHYMIFLHAHESAHHSFVRTRDLCTYGVEGGTPLQILVGMHQHCRLGSARCRTCRWCCRG